MTVGGPAAESRLLVLGAGVFQLSIIRRARELGAYVITADHTPSNPGHRIANQTIDCSTIETAEIISQARQLGIDGVVTAASDVAVVTMAAVRSVLGLPGAFTPELSNTFSTKPAFREFLRREGLSSQRYYFSDSIETVVEAVRGFTFPVVTKPADSSGSRGVILVSEPDELEEALRLSVFFSRSGVVGAEEFLPGVEYGGDLFVKGGRIEHLCVTDKHLEQFTVKGHVLPSRVQPAGEALICAALDRLCNRLGYKEGPMNFDVKIDGQHVNLIEVSPRLGGNSIPDLIRRSTGLDFEAMSVLQALGLDVTLEENQPHGMAGSVILGATRPSIVSYLPSLTEMRSLVNAVWNVQWAKGVGESVNPMANAGDMIGVVCFDCIDQTDYEVSRRRLEDWTENVMCSDDAS
jgi:biotin carboxylase